MSWKVKKPSTIVKSPSPRLVQTEEHPNNSFENAKKYVHASFENTYYLGYRDIPFFIEKYTVGKKAIDYGCGTGRSTRFLKTLGFETIGVDISKAMLTQALTVDEESHYLHIRNAEIPVLDSSYDLAFCCFVFFTVSSKNKILAILKEIHRCLRDEGIFIIVTGSEELYSHDWLSYHADHNANKPLASGSVVKIQLKDLGVDFINYYWTDSDFTDLFGLSGFHLLEKHFPLGNPKDGRNWISEAQYPPYVVYILQKG